MKKAVYHLIFVIALLSVAACDKNEAAEPNVAPKRADTGTTFNESQSLRRFGSQQELDQIIAERIQRIPQSTSTLRADDIAPGIESLSPKSSFQTG